MKKDSNKSGNIILSQKSPWDDNSNEIWLASTICLTRNIEKFKFPNKLDADRQTQIVSLISQEFLASEVLPGFHLIPAEGTSPLEKEYLMEHFLKQQGFQQAHSGEGFIVDGTGTFLGTINVRDHLCLQILDCQGELESSWNKLVGMETAIGKRIAYAYSAKYGFLTSDFGQCGTALSVTVFLQLPALVHTDQINPVLERLADDSLGITGIQGNPTEIIGDILVVKNNYTLGVSEESIVASLRAFVTKIMVEENGAKNKIKLQNDIEIKDKVSRAYGILTHSYQIETIEALNALSLVKLGIELGWVSGMTIAEENKLFFNCRRAHLLRHFEETIKQEELAHKRAEFIHQALKPVKLIV